MNCVFCKIIRGELPAEKVYEDERAVAFLDIKPNNLGHVLLVPKEHARNIFDISEETLCKLVPPLKKISHAVKNATGASGINIAMNNELSAGQIIFHAHIHIIPRFEGDSTEHKIYRDGEMGEIAGKIRSKM
ncbi:MAG: HIT domain-containing protein [Parcubacteria group bacterium]|nr:HIT domain-containing protein [Parcubacteria group bacterium]